MTEWNRKELWRKFGKDFMVEISRHEETVSYASGCFDEEGPHRWCVYAYVYPKHAHFSKFNGTEDMWQDAATSLPFHGGPSFCRKHISAKGEATSYQVGADYYHLNDWRYTQFATQAEACAVFNDADELFERLQGGSETLTTDLFAGQEGGA